MNDRLTRWSLRVIELSAMNPMPDNARTMPDSSMAALEECIAQFGYVEPIVWNEVTGHIIGGHQRYEVLKEKGATRATVVVVDLPEEEEPEANFSLNNPKIEGGWDDTASALLAKVEEADERLFKALRMDKLKESLESRIEKSEDSGIDADEDFDTECPSCGHRWNVDANDVSVEMGV